MLLLYYKTAFAVSFLLTLIYVAIWDRRFDVNITAIFMLVPITNLGHVFMAAAQTQQEAATAVKIIYIGGCFMPFFVTMGLLNICRIRVSRVVRILLFVIPAVLYTSVLSIGYFPLFYSNLELTQNGGATNLIRTYGPMHSLFYPMVIIYILIGVGAIVYTIRSQKQVSKTTLALLFLPIAVTALGFFGNLIVGRRVEIITSTYILAEVMYLLIARRISFYNVSDTVIDSLVQNGDTGFISVDNDYCYLGSNGTARRMIPALNELEVDHPITGELHELLRTWLETPYADVYQVGEGEDERFYVVETADLVSGGRTHGHQFFIRDDTQNQKYIMLVKNYNTELEQDVKAKTKHILEMQNDLVLGMATMVESRDNSTGGHIRRTSMGVRLLVGEMDLDPDFSDRLIKAAPMHDIGKIAVPDKVLQKPGRFTPEEYEQMKKHSPEGARILREILADLDDEEFKRIAVNVAHYHHERWDGKGYPDGLKGEEIPLEARIMAVADVYDALVSKRVYKDKMSFEDADRIICEGMGTQFDPALLDVYLRARPALEDYYIHTDC